MSLYEIDAAIEALLNDSVDPETGEIDPSVTEHLDALGMERESKLENLGLMHKNYTAESKAIADEIKSLQNRKRILDNRIAWQEKILTRYLDGQRFETPRLQVRFRKSTTVEIDDIDQFLADHAGDDRIIRITVEQKPDKTAIKGLLATGEAIAGAYLAEHNNIQIK